MYELIKQCNSGWKMTPFAAKLASNKPCFHHDIFFATGTKVLRKNENSLTLSQLSVLIGRSTLRFLVTGDVCASWLAHRAPTHFCQQQSVCKPHRQTARARAETDQFTLLQLSLQPFRLSSDWTYKRATTNKIICEPEQTVDSQQISCYNISLLAKVNNKL